MKRALLALILFIFQFQSFARDHHKKGDVIMIANGDFDVFIETTEDELRPLTDELGIDIGATKIVDESHLDKVLKQFKPIKSSYGGSAANTAYILSSLGKKNGIYVVLSDEELSKGFIKNLEDVGIANYGVKMSEEDRGDMSVMTQVISFISNSKTNKSERTFVASKGHSGDFSKIKFDLSHIKNYKMLYIEGYIFSPNSRDVIFDAIEEAKKHDVKVLFSPSNPFFVNAFRDDFKKIIEKSDIVFTNRGEIEALYESNDAKSNIDKISSQVKVTIITNGRNGSTVTSDFGKKRIEIDEAIDQSLALDTTGAGDAYLAGFLYAYLNGYDMEKAGKTGALVANHIIQEISARPSDKMMGKIKMAITQNSLFTSNN